MKMIILAEGRENPGNQGRLCVKGRYGWDYAQHAQRLQVPLIRKDSAYPKSGLSSEVRGTHDGRRKPGGIVVACFSFGVAEAIADGFQGYGSSISSQAFLALPFVVSMIVLAGFVGKSRPPAALGSS